MDIFYSVFGDTYTREMLAAIALLVLAMVLWLVWKFFFALFKHVLTALFIAAIASGVYYYVMNQPPPQDPNVGKHAYGTSSSRYLGVIEAGTADSYVVRLGNAKTTVPKARVIVKEKMDPVAIESPSPAPSAKPRPASSGKKATR
jgi:hypothetical protein